MKIYAIIPAGGKGSRTGLKVPKQYLKISGKEMIVYTLQNFQKNKQIDEIIVAADPANFKLLENLKKKYRLSKIIRLVTGGKERQDSVYSALLSLKASDGDLVCVHDAARPLLSAEILTAALNTAQKKGNAVVCLKAKDTLIQAGSGYKYLDRRNTYYIQTPQIFKFSVLKKSMQIAFSNNFYGTDESELVSKAGEKLNFVEGSVYNLKITDFEDMSLLKKLLK